MPINVFPDYRSFCPQNVLLSNHRQHKNDRQHVLCNAVKFFMLSIKSTFIFFEEKSLKEEQHKISVFVWYNEMTHKIPDTRSQYLFFDQQFAVHKIYNLIRVLFPCLAETVFCKMNDYLARSFRLRTALIGFKGTWYFISLRFFWDKVLCVVRDDYKQNLKLDVFSYWTFLLQPA